MTKPKYDPYTVTMSRILREMLIKNPTRVQARMEIRERWFAVYPHHNIMTKNSRGTRGRNHIQNAIKDLERRGVINRVETTHVVVIDTPQLVQIADWDSNEED